MSFKKIKSELLIFAILFLAGAAFYHPVEYDNTSSRYLLLSAIVDYKTLNIDVNQKNTIDKSERNGHYYSNKAPGASFLAIPVYWSLRNLTSLKIYKAMSQLNMYIVRVMTTTLIFALLGVVMYRLALFYGAFPRQAFLMVIAYGFGSIALLHATLFSGHQIAASLGFFSFALLGRFPLKDRIPNIKILGYGFIAGLLAGFAVITDYTAIVISIFLALYVLVSKSNARFKTGFILGACVCVLILAAYNISCFGHPFSFSYSNLAYEKFREGSSHGFLGLGLPTIDALIGLLISPSRGIFFIMPVMLLSFWGISEMISTSKHRQAAILISLIVISSFIFVAGFYAWHGGWTFGPRYLVPMLPFLAFPIAFLNWRSYVFWLLFIPSCAQVGLSVIGVPHTPNLMNNPIVELIIPCIRYGYTSVNAGMLFGLSWPWSAILVIVCVGSLSVWAYRESGRGEIPKIKKKSALTVIPLMLWICIVVWGVAVTRTIAQDKVRLLRQQVFEDSAIIYNNKGIAYGIHNQNQRAIEEFSKAIGLRPTYAEAYNNRAFTYFKIGQYKLAMEDSNQAIHLKPDYIDAYSNRAVAYLKQGKEEQGCNDARRACQLGDCKTLESAKSMGVCR